jgi:hypothetical protein
VDAAEGDPSCAYHSQPGGYSMARARAVGSTGQWPADNHSHPHLVWPTVRKRSNADMLIKPRCAA